MIPKNITKNNIIKALKYIDGFGVPKNRESTNYKLEYKGKVYPPKYVISIANKYSNQKELEPSEFGGGNETNSFLSKLGFKITNEQGRVINKKLIKSEKIENKSIIIEEEIKRGNKSKMTQKIKIATVLNSLDEEFDPDLYFTILRDISKKADIILFPAGYFHYVNSNEYTQETLELIVDEITNILKESEKLIVVCLGVDVDNQNDQIALAIDNSGIISKARKFHPTQGEKGYIRISKDYLENEDKYERTFEIKNKKFYLAVCYDIYGIRQKSLDNPGVDYILNLIHGFYPKEEGKSGDVYFARLGLGGASKQWDCPVFASATFIRRDIPKNWPSGFMLKDNNVNLQSISYEDNILTPIEIVNYNRDVETVEIRIFEV